MDYSKTVHLPKTDFPMKADLPKREPEMRQRWDDERVYEEALKRRQAQQGKKQFILHDGPPYANGHLHLGHALNKILKDIIVRSKTMAGFYAPYVPGWDCHGLPIELQLMKELKVTDKHKVDRAQFRQQAHDFAQRFVDIQRNEFKRMGILGDWDHPYLTMNEAYKKTIVDTFLELQKQGYVFKGKKPVYWCTTDETALAEAEVEYENDKGPSIFVAFPNHTIVLDESRDKQKWASFEYVIWTTTPWTLPSNLAIAYNPDETYVLTEGALTLPSPAVGGRGNDAVTPSPASAGEGRGEGSRKFLIASKRFEEFQKITGFRGVILDEIPGRSLQVAKAHHPWINRIVPLLPADFVAMDTGTGLVHIAPGHGREDYVLGMQNKLDVLSPVDDRGRLQKQNDEPEQPWHGVHVFKANGMIMDFLAAKGALLYRGELEHSYPHCWRCHKPVIFRATDQWFLSIDHKELRNRALRELKNVAFFPEFGRNRITGMIESRPDWCLSRQRLWGTEIPSKETQKDPDIFDVWFESGVSWAAVLQQRSELGYPADMYLEGSDQHRGWFQVSLIPSVALNDKAPFRSLLTHGFVMDGEGRPMSKSLGNVISPEEIIKQYGADVLRLWVASSDYAGDVRLSPEILKGAADAYRKVRNTLRYLMNNLFDFDPTRDTLPPEQLQEIDRWVLHRLQEEVRDALGAYERYEFHRAVSRLVTFCGNELSSFYLDIAKDRLYCDSAHSRSRRGAQTALYQIATALIRLLAPVTSFTADEAWRFMGHGESVALADFPTVNNQFMDAALGQRWERFLQLRERVLGEIEKARAQGVVKASREAAIQLTVPDAATLDFFRAFGAELAANLSVSQIAIQQGTAEQIVVTKAAGAKCARCWIFKNDIGADGRWPDVCKRCASVLDEAVPA